MRVGERVEQPPLVRRTAGLARLDRARGGAKVKEITREGALAPELVDHRLQPAWPAAAGYGVARAAVEQSNRHAHLAEGIGRITLDVLVRDRCVDAVAEALLGGRCTARKASKSHQVRVNASPASSTIEMAPSA